MSSEALERIRELAESGRLHTWDIRRASDGHMSAVESDVSPDVLALLAEVARLEQERDYAAECRDNMQGWAKRAEASGREARAALAVAREREQRAVDALREWIEAEDEIRRASEALTNEDDNAAMRCALAGPVARLTNAQRAARAALVDEPAAATLAEPEHVEGEPAHDHRVATSSGSASAAADEPGERPCPACGATDWLADYQGPDQRRVDHCAECGWPPPMPMSPEEYRALPARGTPLEACDCGSAQEDHGWACRCSDPPSKRAASAAADEPGETP